MKVITVVGIRKSGKTSTVTALIEAIRRRGLRVGTGKTVFCPTFSMDKEGTNTDRHRAAGASIVASRARHETALIIPEALSLPRLLASYRGCDWVLLEGDYRADVPRLVAAHSADDALPRMNDRTLAFVGRVSGKPELELPLPHFNALNDADALLDFLDARVPDAEPEDIPAEPLPPLPGVSDDGYCQCGCHKHQKKACQTGVTVTIDGETMTLTREQEALIRSWASGPV